VLFRSLEGISIPLTSKSVIGLSQLCEEFGFPIERFESQTTHSLLSSLDERFTDQEMRIEFLTSELSQQRQLNEELRRLLTTAIQRVETLEKKVIGRVESLRSGVQIDSTILTDFPTIFDEFRSKTFRLLWRGSKDGFSPEDFHRHCDGHPNTLTVIKETRGFVFGGYTPVRWESGNYHAKGDETGKSFLFTIRNPHNTEPMRFSLKEGKKGNAIWCYNIRGPGFGGTKFTDCDLQVRENCTTNQESKTSEFGSIYNNDSGFPGDVFFTGSKGFTVKEIEVFQIE
jgi:uncharacterized coiled-coil protein SlyX